ncbi:MAG: hypothetical protein KDK90_07165 [Leptospiraceae bacterium]|nr:hypothetical protein [Leptospiraceae bacterium]
MFSHKYNSDFAVQITSNIPSAQKMTIQFANNNLNGKTRFKPELIDYNSSKTRVCVTVGMMTTGYDCEDILNVRPIFSPTDYIQIKGRGTRLFTFRYNDSVLPKDKFYLFDFFANHQYFEEEFNYKERLELPKEGTGKIGDGDGIETFAYTGDDSIQTIEEEIFDGEHIMRVDKEAFSKNFEEKAKEDVNQNPDLQEALEEEDWNTLAAYIMANIFDKPKEFWNLDRLRNAYDVDRRLDILEVVKKVFGKIHQFKSKSELIEEDFERFLAIEKVDASMYYEFKTLFHSYLMYEDIRLVFEESKFGALGSDPRISLEDLKILGKEWIQKTIQYIKHNKNPLLMET